MDIGKSISFVFEDEQWLQKVLIGGLVVLGGILFSWTVIGAFLAFGLIYGYMLETIQNVRRGVARPLPEWDEWGEKTVKGVKLLLLQFIWALPIIIVAIPSAILGGIFDNTDAQGIAAFISVCFGCLSALYGIFVLLVTPAITIRFAETEEFSAGLNVSDILAFTRQHLGEVIIVTIVVIAVQFVAGIVGAVLCGIGLLFTTFWGYLVQGHLYAQIGMNKGGQAVGETSLRGPGPSRYDLTPDDVMPGMGELVDDVESGAQSAVEQVEDVVEDDNPDIINRDD